MCRTNGRGSCGTSCLLASKFDRVRGSAIQALPKPKEIMQGRTRQLCVVVNYQAFLAAGLSMKRSQRAYWS